MKVAGIFENNQFFSTLKCVTKRGKSEVKVKLMLDYDFRLLCLPIKQRNIRDALVCVYYIFKMHELGVMWDYVT